MNFLPTSDQADYDGPVFVAIKIGQEKRRLRLVKAVNPLSRLHKRRGLALVPSTLRFIKDNNMIERGINGLDSIVTKMVDMLDEALDWPQQIAITMYEAVRVSPRLFIPYKRGPENLYKGAVARQED